MRKINAGFLRDESGATAIEYALIAALIGTALIVALQSLGQTVSDMYAGIGRARDDVVARQNRRGAGRRGAPAAHPPLTPPRGARAGRRASQT
jgi:pilus assembly protein Flp/PilA